MEVSKPKVGTSSSTSLLKNLSVPQTWSQKETFQKKSKIFQVFSKHWKKIETQFDYLPKWYQKDFSLPWKPSHKRYSSVEIVFVNRGSEMTQNEIAENIKKNAGTPWSKKLAPSSVSTNLFKNWRTLNWFFFTRGTFSAKIFRRCQKFFWFRPEKFELVKIFFQPSSIFHHF